MSKLLSPEESLQKFFKDITKYLFEKSQGDVKNIPKIEEIGHYIEEAEYKFVYDRVVKMIEEGMSIEEFESWHLEKGEVNNGK